MNARWKRYEEQNVAEYHDALFDTRMSRYLSGDIKDAQEFDLMGEVAGEVLRRASERRSKGRQRGR